MSVGCCHRLFLLWSLLSVLMCCFVSSSAWSQNIPSVPVDEDVEESFEDVDEDVADVDEDIEEESTATQKRQKTKTIWDRFYSLPRQGASQNKEQNKDEKPNRKLPKGKTQKTAQKNLRGSLTITTFGYAESSSLIQLSNGATQVSGASDRARLFADTRPILNYRDDTWDFRLDARLRLSDARTQSGTFGGNEYQLRELFLRKKAKRYDVQLGRMFLADFAGFVIDGVRIDVRRDKNVRVFGFGGLYPSRTSRSLGDDYPAAKETDVLGNTVLVGGAAVRGSRIFPVSAGLGVGYTKDGLSLSSGVGTVMSLSGDTSTQGALEQPRILLSSNGYWRPKEKLDVYHYVVIDLYGSAGFAFTNLSVGSTYRVTPDLRLTGGLNVADTETLNAIAQSRLEDRDSATTGVHNNIEVTRISHQSLRGAASLSMAKRRYEATLSTTLRRRPKIIVQDKGGNTVVEVPSGQSAELGVRFVDRRSIAGLRLQGQYQYLLGFGKQITQGASSITFGGSRSDVHVLRISGIRDFSGGKASLEGNIGLVAATDDNREFSNCSDQGQGNISCYGTAKSTTISAGGLLYYRLSPQWFVVGNVSVGVQSLTTVESGLEVSQPGILMVSGLGRLAYRF